MTSTAGAARIAASAAAEFASLGLLEEAGFLLEPLGWDGRIERRGRTGSLGAAYEATVAAGDRLARGVHYTPPKLARGLVGLAVGRPESLVRVGDPACGAGVFLVAAAEAMAAVGVPVRRIVAEGLHGADLDPVAVAVTRIEIALWAARAVGTLEVVPADHLCCTDSLTLADPPAWVHRPAWCDVIVGNPPFGAQLRGATVRDATARARLESDLGLGPLGYADTAALFLARSLDQVRSGGRVALILPRSVVAARDAAPIRAAVDARARCTAVWTGGSDVGFDAAVSVWAPVFVVGSDRGAPEPIRRFHGADLQPLDTVDPDAVPGRAGDTWASLVWHAPGSGPRVRPTDGDIGEGASTVGSVARVTAGFRRHYYALAAHVHDDPEATSGRPELVTTGAIDPLHHRLGAPVRFAGAALTRPVIDLDGLDAADPGVARWVRDLLVPKVLVASQGRVVEAIVDVEGTMIPSTPVIAVVPKPDADVTVWQLAAALTSPGTALALQYSATGTGMDGAGCRVSTAFVSGVALPRDRDAWGLAVHAARAAARAAAGHDGAAWSAALDRLGATLAGDELAAWWREQRPAWRGARLLSA